jgi:hypothetical protein
VVLGVLASDRLCSTWQARLALHGLAGDELATCLERLVPELHAEALMAVASDLESDSSLSLEAAGDDDWRRCEARLAAHADERLRRLALAALVRQSQRLPGWTELLRSRLDDYRADRSVLVASAAAFRFPTAVPRPAEPESDEAEPVDD